MTAAVAGSEARGALYRFRSIVTGSAGNLVEIYDWFAYASFALYFAKAFFPKGDQTAQLLSSAGVFAVGFFFRPVGAWLMGIYADRAGRKAAMLVSISLMCLGSLVIAVCPGYAAIGVGAPTILVLARILQGVSLGGEYGTSATYMSEMAGRAHRGFWSGMLYFTLIGGQLLAIGALLVLQAVLTPAQLDAWGWRIPFVIGGVLALSVFWLRRGMHETPSFEARGQEDRARAMLLFTRFPRESLVVIGLTAGGTLSYYTFTTYIQKFLVDTAGFSKEASSQINAGTLLLFMLMQPAMGALSDRIGRRPLLIAFGVLSTLCTWPILWTLSHTRDYWQAFGLITAALAIIACYSSVNAVVKAELFPTGIRALGVALPYSIANALFGGTAEYVALWFKKTVGQPTWFFTYVTTIVAISCAIYIGMRDTRAHSRIIED